MVIMERSKLPELAGGTSMQEQNTTDEEKSAATGLESVQWSRPFLDMVYHALDSPDDDYHALFVLCLLYAMSHNKGKPAHPPAFLASLPSAVWREERKLLSLRNFLSGGRTPSKLLFNLFSISQVLFYRLKPQELVTQATWVEKKIQV